MEEIIRRLLNKNEGKLEGPISIHLDPTNKCNLQCRFCWQRSHERIGLVDIKNELSIQKLLDIVRDASELGVKDWLISGGGEPLVREGIVEVMKEIKKNNMHGDMITNGTLLTEGIIKDLVEANWDRIRFSINATNSELHDFLVDCEGAFDKAVKAIKQIKRLREELNKKVEIGFNTVINNHNYKEIPLLVKFLHELGGEILNLQTIILYSDKEKIYALDKEQRVDLRKYLKRALKIAKRYGIKNNISNYLNQELVDKSNELAQMDKVIKKKGKTNELSDSYCFEPFYLVTIRANGIVGSCRLFGDEGVDIHDKTLKDVWFGDYFEKARASMLSDSLPDYCKKCGANEFTENNRIREELRKNEFNK